MDKELRQRFTNAVGIRSVHATHALITPADRDAVVAAVQVCVDTGTPLNVTSTDPGIGRAVGGVTIALHRLTGVAVAEGGLTVRAEAGVLVAALRTAAAAHRLAVVGLPDSTDADHVGGMIARGEVPRRSLTGVEAVLPTGEFVTFGGAVLKDVVGYDLPAVLLGSMGWLALITAVTFRLEPEAAKTPVAPPPGRSEAVAQGLLLKAFDPQGLLLGTPV